MEATLIIWKESETERRKRILEAISLYFKDRARMEAKRRQIWLLEEEERVRRMREYGTHSTPVNSELKEKMQEELQHKVNKYQAIQMEERERLDRMLPGIIEDERESIIREAHRLETRLQEELERKRREKDGSWNPEQEEHHEQVMEEFMSVIHKKEAITAEELERNQRIIQDRILDAKVAVNERIESELNRQASIFAEETERARRILEEKVEGINEHLKREILRRQTWLLEEKERRRRIGEQLSIDFQEDILRAAHRQEVLILEEKERRRRISEKPNPEKDELHEQIQEEFMSKISRMWSARAEEAERKRILEEELLHEKIQSEIDRRVTWVLEERERTRRIMQELSRDYEDRVLRELHRHEVIELEEKERERRIRAEKTKSEPHFSEQKDRVLEELISKKDRELVGQLEEEERKRRIKEENALEKKENQDQAFYSKVDLVLVKAAEEEERQRRITEELHARYEEEIQRETERRKSFLLEEEERKRRIEEWELIFGINLKVAEKVGTGKEKPLDEEAIKKWSVEK